MADSIKGLSVAEARQMILTQVKPVEAENVPLVESLGRVLAGEIVARDDLPPFTNSGMDGYAVRASDLAGVSATMPVTLQIVADIPAGALAGVRVGAGQAARVMTGAVMPAGADAVVPVEWTGETRAGRRLPEQIQVFQKIQPGDYVRPAGEDVRRGQTVMRSGTFVRPQEIALLAALGYSRVEVVRRPRVAVLSTGDELVEAGQPLAPGQVRDVNSLSLRALVVRCGGTPVPLGIVRDDEEELLARLTEGLGAGADMVLVSAGVSVGAYDLVKEIVETEGEVAFWQVRMRPGKPLAFGHFGGVPFFGLPGNPVSAMLTFEQFVRPALLKMSGRTRLSKPVIMVELQDEVSSDGRETYVRARVERRGERYVAHSSGGQGSAILSALQQANALVVIPEGQTYAPPGSLLPAQMLDWPEEVF